MRLDPLAIHRAACWLRKLEAPTLAAALEASTGPLYESVFSDGAELGPDLQLTGEGRGVFIHPGAVIGRAVRLADHVSIEAAVIGDGAVIRHGAKILRGVSVGAGAVIGAYAVVDADVPDGQQLPDATAPATHLEHAASNSTVEVLEMEFPTGARRLRIVEFTRAFYLGGTEVQVVELLRGLRHRHEVQVGVMDKQGPLLAQVHELGLSPEGFPLKGGVYRPNTALQIARLAWWLRKEQVDVIHVHDFSATLIAVPAAKLAGCKVVVGRLDLAHFHSPMQRRTLAALSRAADHVIANAEAIRQMLIREEGIPTERISLVHNALDLPRFDQRRKDPLEAPLPQTGNAPLLIHVANMNHPVKRQEDVLAALARLKANGTEAQVLFVGDGPRRAELEALSRKLGVTDRAHFLGHRKDVPALYGRCSLGLLVSSAEGLSNAIIEGMAASLPMVVTDVGGNPDLIVDGERGRVIPVGSPEKLAEAITSLLQQPAAAAKMGMAARRFVERELTLDRMIRAHEAVYRHVVDGAPLPREPEAAAAIPVERAAKAELLSMDATEREGNHLQLRPEA